jgi:hypothetical protein
MTCSSILKRGVTRILYIAANSVVRENKSYLILIIVIHKLVRRLVVVLAKEGLHTLRALGVCMKWFQRTSAVSTTYYPMIPV